MTCRRTILGLPRPLCVAVLLTTAVASADERPAARDVPPPARFAEARCPVTGDPVVAEHRVRFRGRRVYCASAEACAAFRSDPYAYQDGLRAQWDLLTPLRVQLFCPVTGDPVRRDVFVERSWDDVYFASEAARDRWRAEPERFRAGLARAWRFQTTCGTCDALPRGDVQVQAGDQPVYFCCPGCRAAFESDPGPFRKQVETQRQANRRAWERARGPRGPTTRPSTP